MGYRGRARSRPEGGFSLIEMVIVVGLIVTLAAVALPAISRYIRNYRINGAVRNVASEMRTARSQAVSKNVQRGVYLVIVGPTTYRFVREDIGPLVGPPATPGRLGPLLDLPLSVRFQAGNAIGMRFSNLGAACPSGGRTARRFRPRCASPPRSRWQGAPTVPPPSSLPRRSAIPRSRFWRTTPA